LLDLAESLKDGRLFNQAHRLVNSDGLVALILEAEAAI
jgi:ERCC4-type nuclease